MRTIILGLTAASLAIPASVALPLAGASAQSRDYDYRNGDYRDGRRYRDDRDYRDRDYRDGGRRYSDSRAREWRGRDGRTYCRKSDGTTGLIIGGVGGALAGRAIDTRGERTTGTLLGAAAGALLGKSVDSNRRCQ